MKPRDFTKYLARDLRCVCGCTGREDTFVPQHRAGRGMGGSRMLDRPSNIIVMCSELNGLIESDASTAQQARANGWKLNRWQDPTLVPVFDATDRSWFLLDDNYHRKPLYLLARSGG